MNYEETKRNLINKIGFLGWAKLDKETVSVFSYPGQKYEQIWISPDVESLWIAFVDESGMGSAQAYYYDLEDHDSLIEFIYYALDDAGSYTEGEKNIMKLVDGFEYKEGSEITLSEIDLESM